MTSGLEVITGLDKLSIHQCQELAKKIGVDKCTFDLCGPNGKRKAKWLDAYMGMFQIDDTDGFMLVQQVEFWPDIWCENLMPVHPEVKLVTGRRDD